MTAVLVAHDGATWLNQVIDALLGQSRPVQRVVAVDTGSRDRSGAVLAAKLGPSVVFGMERGTGYGAAVARALQHKAARVSIPDPSGTSLHDRTEWIWLLHDDCEPAPDALEQLLRGAAETKTAAVLGPKVRDWSAREVVLEAGLTIDSIGRRTTGIEPREVDQGQHDGDRDTLAVSSAGMLIRRDVWDQIGGFDAGMALLWEDVDFCWRVHAAEFRVRVITDAVVYHAQAATRRRRPVSVGRRIRMLDRRNALVTLLGNRPLGPALKSVAANLMVSLLRITFFLLAKRPLAALDETAAVSAVLGHPVRLMRARSQRAPGRRTAYGRVRADLPPGRSVRRMVEFAAAAMAGSAQSGTAGAHHASTEDPAEDDSMLVDSGLVQRVLTSPGVWLTVFLTVIALVAERSLLGRGPLGGGGLVPAWGGASDLWRTVLQAFHPSGLGSATPAPPYLAVLALLATVLGGKPWLAVDVVLLGCVPIAGLSAFAAARRVARSAGVRFWAAASYALLPIATGVVAGGRLGSAVAFELLPLIGLLAGRMLTRGGRGSRRAAWATGLAVTIAAAFVPLVWLLAVAAAAVAALSLRGTRPGMLVNIAIAVLTAPVLLLPWTAQLAAHPAELLLEAGLQQPGTASASVPPRSLMLLSPGGPGLPPFWVTAGLALAGLGALLVGRRRRLVLAGWGIALAGLLVAVVASKVAVTPPGGTESGVVWPGVPLAVAALGVLIAASAGADAMGRMLAGRGRLRVLVSPRGWWAALITLTACSAPLLAASWWVMNGVSGPVRPAAGPLVPEIVTISGAAQGRQLRTLALTPSAGHVSYALLRGASPSLADAALLPSEASQQALSRAVADLLAPDGGGVVNQAAQLAAFDIGYVLLRAPVDQQLAAELNGVAGLHPYSATAGYDLWKLQQPPWRVTIAEPGGVIAHEPSGPISASVMAPRSGGTLELAEPVGGWTATLNGRPLTPVPSPAGGWAQAFQLPPGGGRLDISHPQLGFSLLLLLQALAFAAVAILALPGARLAAEETGSGASSGQRSTAARTDATEEAAAPSRPAAEAGTVAGRGSRTQERQAGRGRGRRAIRRSATDRAGPDRAGPDRGAPGRPSRDKAGRVRGGALALPGRRGDGVAGLAAMRAGREAGRPAGWPDPDESNGDAGGWPHSDEPAGQQAGSADDPGAGRPWPADREPPRWQEQAAAPGTSGWPEQGASPHWQEQAAGPDRSGWPEQGRTLHWQEQAAGPDHSGWPEQGGSPHSEEQAAAPATPGWPGSDAVPGRHAARQQSGWPAGSEPDGWPDDGRSDTQAWPASAQRSGRPGRNGDTDWPADRGRAGGRPDGGSHDWPADDSGRARHAAPTTRGPAARMSWPAAEPMAGWPGGGETLDPLPPSAHAPAAGRPERRTGGRRAEGRRSARRSERRSADRAQPAGDDRSTDFGRPDDWAQTSDTARQPGGREHAGSRRQPGGWERAGGWEQPGADPDGGQRWPAPDAGYRADAAPGRRWPSPEGDYQPGHATGERHPAPEDDEGDTW